MEEGKYSMLTLKESRSNLISDRGDVDRSSSRNQ